MRKYVLNTDGIDMVIFLIKLLMELIRDNIL